MNSHFETVRGLDGPGRSRSVGFGCHSEEAFRSDELAADDQCSVTYYHAQVDYPSCAVQGPDAQARGEDHYFVETDCQRAADEGAPRLVAAIFQSPPQPVHEDAHTSSGMQ